MPVVRTEYIVKITPLQRTSNRRRRLMVVKSENGNFEKTLPMTCDIGQRLESRRFAFFKALWCINTGPLRCGERYPPAGGFLQIIREI